MRPDKATCRQVAVRAVVLSLASSRGVRFRFHASADGATWREIDSFDVEAIGVYQRTYPEPVEPKLRVLSEPLGGGGTAVVRTEILRSPEPEGPRAEGRN